MPSKATKMKAEITKKAELKSKGVASAIESKSKAESKAKTETQALNVKPVAKTINKSVNNNTKAIHDYGKTKKEVEKLKVTPELFLAAIDASNKEKFEELLKAIKALDEKNKAPFLTTCDKKGRNALILAAKRDSRSMVHKLLDANFNFELTTEDAKGKTALCYLLEANATDLVIKILDKCNGASSIDPKLAEKMAVHAATFVKESKISKKRMGDALTHNPTHFSKSGRVPKMQDTEVESPYRTFAGQRELQLLRHFSTQLFNGFNVYLKDQGAPLFVETQTLHLRMPDSGSELGRHNLFIAVNEHAQSSYLSLFFEGTPEESLKKLHETLKNVYKPREIEGQVRSVRFSDKLKARVLNAAESETTDFDQYQHETIARIIRTGKIRRLMLNYEGQYNALPKKAKNYLNSHLKSARDTIFLVIIDSCGNMPRHAEEFLTDIVECAKEYCDKLEITDPVYSAIAGKKRPCMGCAGRMEGVIDTVSQNPGLFWSHTVKEQNTAVSKRTANTLLTKKSHITLTGHGVQDAGFDSGSDSECEGTEVTRRSKRNRRK